MNGGRKVLIHYLLRLRPILDIKLVAQYRNIVEVFLSSARDKLTGQYVSQVIWDIEIQLAVLFEQAHGRKLVLAQLQ